MCNYQLGMGSEEISDAAQVVELDKWQVILEVDRISRLIDIHCKYKD